MVLQSLVKSADKNLDEAMDWKEFEGFGDFELVFRRWPQMWRILQGVFFNWSALKMTKCQITCKSLQKSSKCQNFLRVWYLVIFREDQ